MGDKAPRGVTRYSCTTEKQDDEDGRAHRKPAALWDHRSQPLEQCCGPCWQGDEHGNRDAAANDGANITWNSLIHGMSPERSARVWLPALWPEVRVWGRALWPFQAGTSPR